MRYFNKITFLAVGLCMALSLQAQPKREFRAAWLTTVWGIDWPTSYSQSTEEGQQKQQNELRAIVDSLAEANMNAVFFQVRGFSDAMYKSQYEPWSQYLTGTRGGEPTYDPLQLLIDYAHAKGIEVHAWMNPYRYSSSDATYGKNHEKDYHNTHPEWLVKCDALTILNPSLPEVREQICKVVADVVENYDIDGVIFDDYFHQNGYKDSYDQEQYNATGNGLSRADWRRAQNNLMVKMVNDTIKAVKPWVKFSIGPAGKAGASADKYGVEHSPIGGDWQYDGIYADPLAWYNEHTIDFMAPQVYWKIGSSSDYDQLTRWWSDMAGHFGRHMYVSQSLSSLKPDNVSVSGATFHASEIVDQINLNRIYDRFGAPGFCWYGLKTGLNTANFIQNIRKNACQYPAVVPQMHWYKQTTALYVSNIRKNGQKLTWDAPADNLRYAVYCVPTNYGTSVGITASSKYLLGTTYTNSFQVPTVSTPAGYTYAVAVLDRYGNEYPARTYGSTSLGKSESAELLFPANNAAVLLPCNATWSAAEGADSYFFQVSKSSDFSTIDYECETVDTTFYLGKVYWLKEGKAYWRVCTRSINKEDAYSTIYALEASTFDIVYPTNGDVCDLMPTIICDSILYPNVEYTFEIADKAAFAAADVLMTAVTKSPRYTLQESLVASRNYYLRVTAKFEGNTVVTSTIKFRTKAIEVPIPVIVSPINGENIIGNTLTVVWKEQLSSGFQVQIAQQNNFPPRFSQIRTLSEIDIFSYTFEGLDPGTWYIRVMAMAEGGYTEPSEVVTVTLNTPTATDEMQVLDRPTKLIENGRVYILRNGKTYDILGNSAQ